MRGGILLALITVAAWNQVQPQAALQAKGTLSQSCKLCLPQSLSMSTSHFGQPSQQHSRPWQLRPPSVYQLSVQHSRMSEARMTRGCILSMLATLQMLEVAAAQVKMRHSPALSCSRWVAAGGWYQVQIGH